MSEDSEDSNAEDYYDRLCEAYGEDDEDDNYDRRRGYMYYRERDEEDLYYYGENEDDYGYGEDEDYYWYGPQGNDLSSSVYDEDPWNDYGD